MASPNFSLDYYLSLATGEYRASPMFMAWLTANLQLFQDVLNCVQGFTADLDIDQAVGPQLDTLGLILGQPRTLSFQPSDSVSPVLDDSDYRLLLQATVQRNHWNGLLLSLRAIWNDLFPSGILLFTDNQNMSVNFYIAAPFTSIIEDLINNDLILPRPQGVQYIFSFAALPLLGFDFDNGTIAGWAALAAETTGTTTEGSPTVTVASATGIVDGQTLYGTGIPLNTTITISGTTVTMSNNATAAGSGVNLAFYTTNESGHFA